eukprot:3425924-Amphidinium_carterae.1
MLKILRLRERSWASGLRVKRSEDSDQQNIGHVFSRMKFGTMLTEGVDTSGFGCLLVRDAHKLPPLTLVDLSTLDTLQCDAGHSATLPHVRAVSCILQVKADGAEGLLLEQLVQVGRVDVTSHIRLKYFRISGARPSSVGKPP